MFYTVYVSPALFVTATFAALLFGAGYAYLLQNRLKWLADNQTELSVVVGVAGTLLISLLVTHIVGFFILLWLFICTGAFQVARSAYNREMDRRAKEARKAEAKAALKIAVKEAQGAQQDVSTQTSAPTRNGANRSRPQRADGD